MTSDAALPTFEGYDVLRVIGEGGMGTVYLAEDLKHDRRVAIKTIRRDFVNPDVARRFEREIRMTSSLQHPRILPLLDSGSAEGSLYYVMQFIDGESLEQRLEREGQLPMDDALRIARHVADALDYAHSRGIVHRDIKPANMMLAGGHSFVMDFGIARALSEGSAELTGTGSALGTPKYMSPEQVADSTAVDGRSDIYSLGCVLFEMVAGQPPFTGRSVDSVLRQHLAADPPRLALHRPGAAAEVDEIVQRALAKSPADRFQTAGEMVDALRETGAPGAVLEESSSTLRRGIVVVGAYLIGAWGVITVVERIAESSGMPEWTVPFAVILLLVGLLAVTTTVVIQAAGRGTLGGGTDPGATAAARRARRSRKRLADVFSWRNVAVGGVMALALWGVVATGALVRERGASDGLDAAARPIDEDAVLGDDDPTVPDTTAVGTETANPAPAGNVADAGGRETVAPVPPPPASPARQDDRAAIDLAGRARDRAEQARGDAEAAGARVAPTAGLARADSLWASATRAEDAGRFREAELAFDGSASAYRDAARETGGILAVRVDSARRAIDALRSAADADAAAYASGETHRTRAIAAQGRGEFAAALEALGEAGDEYRRAAPPPTTESEEPEPAASPPPIPPSTRVASAMSALERAFEAEDLAAVRRIWVNLTSDELDGFEQFFEQARELDYRYEVNAGSVRTSGDSIEFRVSVEWQYRQAPDGRRVSQSFVQDYRLADSDGTDVLMSR